MKKILFFALTLGWFFGLHAQTFEVPEGYKLEDAEAFYKYRGDVVQCVNWLIKTPVNQEVDKHRAARAFLSKWINGSPDVHVFLSPVMLPFMESNPAFNLIFMGGWAKYAIESGDLENKLEGSYHGLLAVVTMYENNRGVIRSDKEIEKLVKLHKKGKLRGFVEKNLWSVMTKEEREAAGM
jgi:hypothetical protein